jgi:hypothetical protein
MDSICPGTVHFGSIVIFSQSPDNGHRLYGDESQSHCCICRTSAPHCAQEIYQPKHGCTQDFLHWNFLCQPYTLEYAFIEINCQASLALHCTALNWTELLTALHCTALHCTALVTALHCAALHGTALHGTALHYTTLHCTALHCTALHCSLHFTALHCSLHCAALRCTARHCTALHCTALL